MAFYEGVHRGNKKCRANALPGTIVHLDHPDRDDIVFGIDGRQFRAHAKDSAVAARNRGSVKVNKGANQFTAGIDGALDFKGMEHAIAFDDHINLVGIAVAIVPQETFLGVVVIRFEQLRDDKVF